MICAAPRFRISSWASGDSIRRCTRLDKRAAPREASKKIAGAILTVAAGRGLLVLVQQFPDVLDRELFERADFSTTPSL